MNLFFKKRKLIALFFLINFTVEIFSPAVSYALTSGPSQPEMAAFSPVSASNMVDLFSGDFSYNIPLLDVGGYPLNLVYNSGANMDDEASWVGYGWSLNPGAITRQLRGLPDDFNGEDEVVRDMHMKDHKTWSVKASVTIDALGIPILGAGVYKKNRAPNVKIKKKAKINIKPSLSVAFKHDNYRGWGLEMGKDIGLSLENEIETEKTNECGDTKKDTSFSTKGLNLSMSNSSMDGISFNPNISFSMFQMKNTKADSYTTSSSFGFSYNTRIGLTDLTLGISTNKKDHDPSRTINYNYNSGSSISFVGENYSPVIDMETKNNSYTLSLEFGTEVIVPFGALGLTGNFTEQHIEQTRNSKKGFGFLHSEQAANSSNEALMDFNKEKDNPHTPEIPYIAIPVPTSDFFSVNSQEGGGQYKLHRNSPGIFSDPKAENTSNSYSAGLEIGPGSNFDVGVDLYYANLQSHSSKWVKKNYFLEGGNADFTNYSANDPLNQPAYFKKVGESTPVDKNYNEALLTNNPIAVAVKRAGVFDKEGPSSLNAFKIKSATLPLTSKIKRNQREVRNSNFTYLTAGEAQHHALEKELRSYTSGDNKLYFGNCGNNPYLSLPRVTTERRTHHISEVTVTNDNGNRMIYGIPVYNLHQEEVTFSVSPGTEANRNSGLITYGDGDASTSNNNGREAYYSKQTMPPYATSYLLTAILSPDYIDKTNNGVTDDDQGTAVKFNYSKGSNYNWRTPYKEANYQEGLLSDPRDDKANYVYGERETWYMHSIESKTMVAWFKTEDREDGLGVVDNKGGKNDNIRLKRLKEIWLYSKADLKEHNYDMSATTPIKVVHFDYELPENSLGKEFLNSTNGMGKLTLKRVYFTYGKNNKGYLNPYVFDYYKGDQQLEEKYQMRQYDRWGNYKESRYNPGGLNNAEFPYTLQNQELTDKFLSRWQLKKITLPSGGVIDVTYESDDYAYVQDRRAMEMFFIKGIQNVGQQTGLIGAKDLFIGLREQVNNTADLKKKYFEGINDLFFKVYMDVDNKGHWEFVPGYAQIDPKSIELIDSYTAKVRVINAAENKRQGYINPITRAGWQFLRMNLPKYAYPGSENIGENQNLKQVFKSLLGVFKSMIGNWFSFDLKARTLKFGDKISLEKSWVRLCTPSNKKLGGGLRVKRIDISDEWNTISGVSNAKTAKYSQLYDYTTTINGVPASSGVASYEPMIGNEENPFREPVPYRQKIKFGLDNFYYIEKPFGESFFPGASVGYSKVSVRSVGAGDSDSKNRTGTVVSEYYTAKDFPTIVKEPITEKIIPKPGRNILAALLKIVGGVSFKYQAMTQGLVVELNDMHGKPKSTKIYNRSNEIISSEEYFYKTDNNLALTKKVNNNVKLIDASGIVSDGVIGQETELFTDMREGGADNLGFMSKFSGGLGGILIFPLPFVFPAFGGNFERKLNRQASTVKIIQNYGILEKVKKMENGSTITTENLLWDAVTGNVLETKVHNEFKDPVYNFTYPAHWAYDGMGPAYKNIGTFLQDFSSNTNGTIVNSTYANLLVAGDELININSGQKMWVVFTDNSLKVIDQNGALVSVQGADVKILRSGRRNMSNAAIETIASLIDPVQGGQLSVTQFTKILDAKAITFKEEWEAPLKDCTTCPEGYQYDENSNLCYIETNSTLSYISLCKGDQDDVYSCRGTYIYKCNEDGSIDRRILSSTNTFWQNFQNGLCRFTDNVFQTHGFQCYSLQSRQQQADLSSIKLLQKTETAPLVIYKDTTSKNLNAKTSPSNQLATLASSFSSTGPLNRCGVWACDRRYIFHFDITKNIPMAKTYYLGIASDDRFKVYIDGASQPFLQSNGTFDNFTYWHIFPLFLLQGVHTFRFEAINNGGDASFGAELYNNTELELENGTGYNSGGIDTIFSTENMVGQTFSSGERTCPVGFNEHIINGQSVCRQYIDKPQPIFNPYITGVLGNWRPWQSFVYHSGRNKGNAVSQDKTDIRNAGYYTNFLPFWRYNGSRFTPTSTTFFDKWVWSSYTTAYNLKGAEIESKDALERFSSAQYGYLESVPVAVGANTRYREIGYDGFEDYNFSLDCNTPDVCNTIDHFNFRKEVNNNQAVISNDAHSGKHSLAFTGTIQITRPVSGEDTYMNSPFTINNFGQYVIKESNLSKGMMLMPNKKYILSLWIKDNNKLSKEANASIIIGADLNNKIAGLKWPIVEGWKRVEIPFDSPASGDVQISINSNGSEIKLDDIRLFPYDAQLKTFAYNASNMRLMAEMDENNFATFYEYDDEGVLIRVKKETEKGIMTIKESRSSYKPGREYNQ